MDTIDTLSGIEAGSRLDELRTHRLQAREQAQATYDALFSPVDDSAMSSVERRAVAAFVAALFDVPAAEQHYARLLREADPAVAAVVTDSVELGRGAGPYGSFHGALASESQAGPELILSPQLVDALGARLAAALRHAHMLALHPRDSGRDRLQPLVDVGWSADGIVTLSQLVSFLAFQVRVVAGLMVLAAEGSR
jgi:CMD domain protein